MKFLNIFIILFSFATNAQDHCEDLATKVRRAEKANNPVTAKSAYALALLHATGFMSGCSCYDEQVPSFTESEVFYYLQKATEKSAWFKKKIKKLKAFQIIDHGKYLNASLLAVGYNFKVPKDTLSYLKKALARGVVFHKAQPGVMSLGYFETGRISSGDINYKEIGIPDAMNYVVVAKGVYEISQITENKFIIRFGEQRYELILNDSYFDNGALNNPSFDGILENINDRESYDKSIFLVPERCSA